MWKTTQFSKIFFSVVTLYVFFPDPYGNGSEDLEYLEKGKSCWLMTRDSNISRKMKKVELFTGFALSFFFKLGSFVKLDFFIEN